MDRPFVRIAERNERSSGSAKPFSCAESPHFEAVYGCPLGRRGQQAALRSRPLESSDLAMKEIFIDPPNGHAFGFPKLFEGDLDSTDLNEWLLENGYPQEWIDLFPGGVECRIIGGE